MLLPAFDGTEIYETKIGLAKAAKSGITRLEAVLNISQRMAYNLEGGALDPANYFCAQI